jgi:microsomal epoxide hydrolase
MEPFSIHVPDAVLDDLRARLARTRWPDEVDGGGWDLGTDRAYCKSWWATGATASTGGAWSGR